jgi:hypothetical protein
VRDDVRRCRLLPVSAGLAALGVGLGLAACAGEPELRAPDWPTSLAARQALVAATERGPVPLEILGAPATLTPERIAALAAEGVPALTVHFSLAEAEPGTRLRLVFGDSGPAPEEACGELPKLAPASPPVALTAALCDGDAAVAGIRGRAAGPTVADTERLIWRSTARLFPDDYPETYGFNLFGSRIRLGLFGSFGF